MLKLLKTNLNVAESQYFTDLKKSTRKFFKQFWKIQQNFYATFQSYSNPETCLNPIIYYEILSSQFVPNFKRIIKYLRNKNLMLRIIFP